MKYRLFVLALAILILAGASRAEEPAKKPGGFDPAKMPEDWKDALAAARWLEKAYAGFFVRRPELKVESTTQAIRFLGSDIAIEEGTFTVRPKDAPGESSRYSSLYVREGGACVGHVEPRVLTRVVDALLHLVQVGRTNLRDVLDPDGLCVVAHLDR